MTEPRYLIPGDYSADPAAHVFGGRLFVYPSHDRDAGIPERDNGDHFDMVDYHAYEILPGADGKLDPMTGEVVDHGVVLRLEDVPWASRQLWDSDVAEKDGRYYMYFSARDRAGSFRIGVAVAERPEGPFVAEPEPIGGSYSIDPCCFADPKTGARYLAFGGLWGGRSAGSGADSSSATAATARCTPLRRTRFPTACAARSSRRTGSLRSRRSSSGFRTT